MLGAPQTKVRGISGAKDMLLLCVRAPLAGTTLWVACRKRHKIREGLNPLRFTSIPKLLQQMSSPFLFAFPRAQIRFDLRMSFVPRPVRRRPAPQQIPRIRACTMLDEQPHNVAVATQCRLVQRRRMRMNSPVAVGIFTPIQKQLHNSRAAILARERKRFAPV